jgi:hypothetical protein
MSVTIYRNFIIPCGEGSLNPCQTTGLRSTAFWLSELLAFGARHVKTCHVVVTKVHFKALNYINFIKTKITNLVNIFV